LTSLQKLIEQTAEASDTSAGTIVVATTATIISKKKLNGQKRKLDVDIGKILSGDKPTRQRKAVAILDPSQSPLKAPSKPYRGRGLAKKKVDPKDKVIRKKEDTLERQVNIIALWSIGDVPQYHSEAKNCGVEQENQRSEKE